VLIVLNSGHHRKRFERFYCLLLLLIPQIFTDQLDMNAVLNHVAFNDAPHIADSLGGFAIAAQTGFHAGILQPVADVVDRCGVVFDPGHGRFQVGGHLVHAHHQDHFWSVLGFKHGVS